ncbi:MAG: SurA N-terminal domain-containing protein [Wenzhouxiangella sp.]|jgi:peptidyl-prolyl cis-trans isomerase D|nr:SurA N-terminal domain-containing protein [Wenzhouxiangella sp.]
MLQAIRERVTGIVAIFILGLLAVPFLFFGLESYISAVPQDAVATVGDQEISTSEFQTSFARYRAELRQQQGDAYDEIATNQPVFRRQHLEQMIDERLLRHHTEAMGLTVSAAMLRDIIAQIPAFQLDGNFDSEAYRQALRASGRTPRGFEQELRDDLLTRMLPSTVSFSTVVTESEIDRMLSLENETRQISLIDIPVAPFREQVEVTEQAVADYYAANQSDFLTTEQVSIRYIELDTVALTRDLELSEEELRQRYEAASQRYLTPEARQASHILIETGADRDDEQARALAMELYERALEGEDFEALAREFSDDPGSADMGGELGWLEPGDMVEPFENALFALTFSGELSEPVRTPFGWHLIRLDEIREPQGMSFEEARDEIQAEYREREAEALYIELSDRLVDLVFADATSLEPLAEELALEIRQTGPFSRAGAVEGIASNERVVDAAFSDLVLLDGAVSDPIELDRNQLVVIEVEEHFPAVPQPLEAVADRIRERLIADGARELARERAEALKEQAAQTDLAELVAADDALELNEHPSVGRFDFQHGPQLLGELFRLPAPGDEPSLHVLPRSQGYALVRLEAVRPGNPVEATEQERNLVRQQIRFRQANEEVLGLLAYLRQNTDIQVVEDRL